MPRVFTDIDVIIPPTTEPEVFLNKTKEQAESLDRSLGFEISKTELLVREKKNSSELNEKETWNHLSPQIFQTSYVELRYILEQIKFLNKDLPLRIVDLGAAYFRIQFVNKIVFGNFFDIQGFEVCEDRILEAKRVYQLQFGSSKFLLETKDIADSDFQIPEAQAVFIYDFGTSHDIEIVFKKLACLKSLSFVVARGGRVRALFPQELKSKFKKVIDNQNFDIWIKG
jgi:hypothetical protein